MTKKIDLLSKNAELWASELYRQHGDNALKVLDETARRTDLADPHRKVLTATRTELRHILDKAAAMNAHKAKLSPFRRLMFRIMYKQAGR